MKQRFVLAMFLCGLSTLPVSATVIFQDDFSSDTAGLDKTTLTNWNLLSGSNVDVGSFGVLCGPAPATCIDSQGSGGNPNGDLATKATFALGPGFNYDLHFTWNNTGGTNSVLFTVGTFSQLLSTSTSPDGTYDLSFTIAAPIVGATIRITDQGPADNVGVAIGHIVLSSDATGVPEPGTLSLILLAGGGLLVVRGLRAVKPR